LYAVVVWHAHDTPQIVHDVIVQVADDADFTQNVRTLYNNDYDNSAGLGVGKDKEYFEDYEGRLIDAKGVSAATSAPTAGQHLHRAQSLDRN
jgi:hypothetical protein